MATANNIIVGGAKVFVTNAVAATTGAGASGPLVTNSSYFTGISGTTQPVPTKSVYDTTAATKGLLGYLDLAGVSGEEVGYTTDGIDVEFAPEFSEVQVDQLLDTAVMFKTSQKVSFKTSFAEGTLKNLARAVGRTDASVSGSGSAGTAGYTNTLGLAGGSLGEFPTERRIIALANGPRVTGRAGSERVFEAYRAISVESVGVPVKRNEATVFPVSFRCLPTSDGVYMKIADRVYN